MEPGYAIRTATWADEPRVAAILGLAFAADPLVRWILPDPWCFLKANEAYPGLSCGPAFDAGTAFLIAETAGTALWMPPGAIIDPRPLEALDERYLDPSVRTDFGELRARSGAYRPAAPHWTLNLIGVDPASRGLGLGAALLAQGLAMCDQGGLPVFLESTNPANLSLYRRFGFKCLAEVRAGGSPPRYPMLRPGR